MSCFGTGCRTPRANLTYICSEQMYTIRQSERRVRENHDRELRLADQVDETELDAVHAVAAPLIHVSFTTINVHQQSIIINHSSLTIRAR